MAREGVYDPSEVFVTVGGRTIRGFAEGTFVEVTRNNPVEISAVVGARGEYALSKNRDKTGTFTLTLLAESPSNSYLDSLVGAESIVPVSVVRNGETIKELVTGPEGWVQERPQKTFDAEAPTRAWLIGVGEMTQVDTAL